MNRLKASTMVELLVVMIISSIVLATAMEGWTIFRLYAHRAAQREERQSRLVDDYMILENMCYLSDSVAKEAGCLNFYSTDTVRWSLSERNSILSSVQSVDISFDSLIVWVDENHEELLRFAFPVGISGVPDREYEKYGYE